MVEDTEEARQNTDKYPRPLNVIEGPLMKVCACVCVEVVHKVWGTCYNLHLQYVSHVYIFHTGNECSRRFVRLRKDVPSTSEHTHVCVHTP